MIVIDLPTRPAARLRQLAAFCLDVVFPPVCVCCRRIGAPLCASCAAQLVRVDDMVCFRCGRVLEPGGEGAADLTCPECRANPRPLSQLRAALRYQEPTSDIIHRFKYEGYAALGRPLAGLMIAGWPRWQPAPTVILPIPLHPRRRRQRGYNQSELLARPLAQALGIPVDTTSLRRTRHTIPQVGLGPDERHENVRGAFAAGGAVAGQHVLLIDDVLTTGATMSAAAAALLAAGAAGVSAYCLARVN